MTKEDIVAMARECGIPSGELYHQNLERFVALAIAAERNRTWTPEHWTEYERGIAAAEREACAKRRGVLAFCPYTGRPRHPSDIASDPHGILILVPDQPIRARGQS